MPPATGSFLLPEGFVKPGVRAVLREGSVLGEAGRHALARRHGRRTRRSVAYVGRSPRRDADPVLLVPGFLAGDTSLAMMARDLREEGLHTYRSTIRANVRCTREAAEALEQRLEAIAARRGTRVQIVGHSLGGMLARGLAVRRPDLVSRIVTMGSPMLAPGAHHPALSVGLDVLLRLHRAGLRGVMSADCVAGACAEESFTESRSPVPDDVDFVAIYSRRDGIVDWRACIDPMARAVEVTASHVGMAVDPRVVREVAAALLAPAPRVGYPPLSAVEVDAGVGA